MKIKTTFLIATLLASGIYSNAQIAPKENKTMNVVTDTTVEALKNVAEKITTFFDNKLKLSAIQRELVSDLTYKLINHVREIRNSDAEKDMKVSHMKNTLDVYDTDMKKILDAPQYKKYLALKKDVREHFKDMREEK